MVCNKIVTTCLRKPHGLEADDGNLLMGLGWFHLTAELQRLKFSNSIFAAATLINFDVISLPVAWQQQ